MQLNINKIKQKNPKMGRRSIQTFLQRRHTDGSNAHEKMLNITVREMQIETTMKYHFTPVRVAIIKKSASNKSWRWWRKGNTVGGNVNWYSRYGEQYGGFHKN